MQVPGTALLVAILKCTLDINGTTAAAVDRTYSEQLTPSSTRSSRSLKGGGGCDHDSALDGGRQFSGQRGA